MKQHTKEKLHFAFTKLIDLILTGIICAIISSLITTIILDSLEIKSKNNERIDSLSSICIGSNRDWVDESFGTPQFTAEKDSYLLCAYTTDDFLLQVVYLHDSVQGYLITAFEENNITIRDLPILFNNGIKLGRISFYEFPYAPTSVSGFITNGSGRAMYYESYYLATIGNYLNYHIAYMDYGFLKGSPKWNMMNAEKLDDEVNADNLSQTSGEIITNRKGCYPNTYGVSEVGLDVENLLFTYDWFDSLKWFANSSNN